MSDQDTLLSEPAEAASTRRLPLLLGVLAVLVVAAGAWVYLGVGGDGEEEAASPPQHDAVSDEAATPVPAPGDVVSTLPVVTYDVFLSRDPFEPVVPEDPPAEVIDTSTTDPLDPGQPTDPSITPVAPVAPADGRCSGTQEVVCDGQVVSLLGIRSDADGELVAIVQVDTGVHELRRGDVFAERYVLLDVTDTIATISYVDESFTLMTGDRVLK